MKQNLKHYLKLGIFLIGISLSLVSCQKDDDLTTSNQSTLKTEQLDKDVILEKLNLSILSYNATANSKNKEIARLNAVNRGRNNDDYEPTFEEKYGILRTDLSFTVINEDITNFIIPIHKKKGRCNHPSHNGNGQGNDHTNHGNGNGNGHTNHGNGNGYGHTHNCANLDSNPEDVDSNLDLFYALIAYFENEELVLKVATEDYNSCARLSNNNVNTFEFSVLESLNYSQEFIELNAKITTNDNCISFYNEACDNGFEDIHEPRSTNSSGDLCSGTAFVIDVSGCDFSSGGGPDGNTDPGSGIPTGGGSGGTDTDDDSDNCTDTIDTSPIDFNPNLIIDLGTKAKKRYLKMLSENPTIFMEIAELATKVNSDLSGELLEDGARFKYISDNNYTPRNPFQRKGSELVYSPNYEENEVVSVHMHQTKAQKFLRDGTPADELANNTPIYSGDDIVEFLDNLAFIESTNPDLTEDVTFIMVALKPGTTNDPNVFALVVNNNGDQNDALAAQQALLNEDTYNEFLKDFEKIVLEEWKKGNCNNACLIENFINFINEYEINGEDLGVSLYQSNVDNNGIITWIKL